MIQKNAKYSLFICLAITAQLIVSKCAKEESKEIPFLTLPEIDLCPEA